MDDSTFESLEQQFTQLENISNTFKNMTKSDDRLEYSILLVNKVLANLLPGVDKERVLTLLKASMARHSVVLGISYKDYVDIQLNMPILLPKRDDTELLYDTEAETLLTATYTDYEEAILSVMKAITDLEVALKK